MTMNTNTPHKRTVLALDDDEINLMILNKGAQEAGYLVKSFTSGDAAWDYLLQHPTDIDIALLDKMMPGLNGFELLKRIKKTRALKHIPVIMQTGDVGVVQMREGLENGAYYYLTKPFHPEILKAVLHSADNECGIREELLQQVNEKHAGFISLMQSGEFTLRTHHEARLLVIALSHAAAAPELVALGLIELLNNAIEHGNMEIGYEMKHKHLLAGTWGREIASRGAQTVNRHVKVSMEKQGNNLHLIIRDEGKGFDWERYVRNESEPLRLDEPNGRGIAKAFVMLDDIRYAGKGNEVHCNIKLIDGTSLPYHTGKAA